MISGFIMVLFIYLSLSCRPHQSGNYTVDACNVSQFEMHVRAILNLPCPQPIMTVGGCITVSVIGKTSMEDVRNEMRMAMKCPRAYIHWHGNNEFKRGRTMAHYTVTGDTTDELIEQAEMCKISPQVHRLQKSASRICFAVPDVSLIPELTASFQLLESFNIAYSVKLVNVLLSPTRAVEFSHYVTDAHCQVVICVSVHGSGLETMLPTMLSSLIPAVPIISLSIDGQNASRSVYHTPALPTGTNVVSVAANGVNDAVHCALRILASGGRTQDDQLAMWLEEAAAKQEHEFISQGSRLDSAGHRSYYRLASPAPPAGNVNTNMNKSLARVNSDISTLAEVTNVSGISNNNSNPKRSLLSTQAMSFYGLANIIGNGSSANSVCDMSDLDNF
jgi:phosphoribosylaminoimidazole carboxylase